MPNYHQKKIAMIKSFRVRPLFSYSGSSHFIGHGHPVLSGANLDPFQSHRLSSVLF